MQALAACTLAVSGILDFVRHAYESAPQAVLASAARLRISLPKVREPSTMLPK